MRPLARHSRAKLEGHQPPIGLPKERRLGFRRFDTSECLVMTACEWTNLCRWSSSITRASVTVSQSEWERDNWQKVMEEKRPQGQQRHIRFNIYKEFSRRRHRTSETCASSISLRAPPGGPSRIQRIGPRFSGGHGLVERSTQPNN